MFCFQGAVFRYIGYLFPFYIENFKYVFPIIIMYNQHKTNTKIYKNTKSFNPLKDKPNKRTHRRF